jgi:peptidylprolyl isomerase
MSGPPRAAVALLLAAALAACKSDRPGADAPEAGAASNAAAPALNPDPAANTFAPALNIDLAKFQKRPSGLYVRDDKPGTGAEAQRGRTVRVAYTGSLPDGTVFDTSEGKDPIEFSLGDGPVIDAWNEGVVGMRVGGVRTIVVPAELGYGAAGVPGIPGNAVLVFRMELVGVQ